MAGYDLAERLARSSNEQNFPQNADAFSFQKKIDNADDYFYSRCVTTKTVSCLSEPVETMWESGSQKTRTALGAVSG